MGRNTKKSGRFGTGASSRDPKSLYAIVFFLFSASLISVFIYWYVKAATESVDERLCPSTGPTSFALILLDLTDEITPRQASSIQSLIQSFIDDSAPGTLFSVGKVVPEGQQSGKAFEMCKPRTGDVANQLYENPKLIARQYQDKFLAPISNAIEDMTAEPSAPNSPILESLQGLVAETEGFRSLQRDDRKRSILIVSDLMQNSRNFSFYMGGNWEAFRAQGLVNEISNSLRGSSVTWLEITRNLRPSLNNTRFEFWKNYFDLAGVSLTRHEKIGNL
jgi:hypothetical protein